MGNETHVEIAGQRVRISSPDKVMFGPQAITKLDVVNYFVAVAPALLRGIKARPCHLKRWPKGVHAEPFYQRRAKPSKDIETAVVRFHSAQPGTLWIPRTEADPIRMAQLGCIDLHPWPVTIDHPDHPDELRLDLDPTPGVGFDQVREVAAVVKQICDEDDLTTAPKTSGSRGIHIYVRLRPQWDFIEVRRAALAIAREAERRSDLATSKWWKEEREGVFIDFNQMARDKTVASAWSLRQTGFVSMPFTWDELDGIELSDWTITTAASRFAETGDPMAVLDDVAADGGDDLTATLARVAADEDAGLGDAPWPPHYRKQPDEPTRVAPSRAKAD